MVKKTNTAIPPFEAVGVIAAQSVGEPGTQMSLESCEKVLILVDNKIKSIEIGKFVDLLMGNSGATKTNNSEVFDIPPNASISVPSLDQNGKIKWKQLLQVSRHKTARKLLKLRTRSGRSIVATDNHSFVIRKNGVIIPVCGNKLCKGDRIPVVRNLPVEQACPAIDLSEYLPKDQYWFGSELKKASALGKGYKNGFGINYNVPVGPEQLGNHILGNHNCVEDGFVYPYMNQSKARIPEQIKLDKSFGWFIGAYLSEGSATKYYIGISNTDNTYQENVRKFAKRFGITMNEYENNRGFAKGHDLRLNSSVLSDFAKCTCGKGSANKRVPDFAYGADESFIGSLLRAYFDGDGNVTVDRKAIRASSNSKDLIDGIAILLGSLGILCSKSKSGSQHTLSISYRYADIFEQKIGFDSGKKKNALSELGKLNKQNTKSYDSNDMVSGFGSVLYDIAKKLSLPARAVNNFTKRQRIGRTALARCICNFENLGKEKKIDISGEISKLRMLLNEDVAWDEIISLEYVDSGSEYVYDFSVPGLETFTTTDGIITHNTMRTFHYAGVAEHVPTGLPRLIEIVDAKKEPKKPIIDIYLKKQYAKKEDEAVRIARDLSSVFVSDVAVVEDDLEDLSVGVEYSEKDGKGLGVTFAALKKTLEEMADKLKIKNNRIIMYPKKTKAKEEEKEKPLSAKAVRRLANKVNSTIVKGVPGIHRAVVVKGKEEYFIRAAGFNITGAIEHEAVDPTRIYTNNIKEIEKVLGIEAARNAILKEIKDVMDMQRLYVDVRHIMLISDAMTNLGKIKSIGRHGLSGEKVGVLGRAAFEETIKHLVNASAFGEEELLVGVTENIIVGQTVPVGTGKIKLVMKPNKKQKK